MSKIMLVNVTHVEESRVAIVENGVLQAYEVETIDRAHIIGNIYNAVVDNVLPSIEAAFVRLGGELKGFLPLDEVNFKLLPARTERGRGRIAQHLHPGQRLIVQVVRAPYSDKPPTVSTYFSLPGRYLVLMPGVDDSGVSRKIEDPERREALRRLLAELPVPEGFGVILRTAGMDQPKSELQRDLRYLLRLWDSIQRSSRETEFPGLVYQERDLVIRTIRDHLTPDIQEVWVDSKDTYERALAFMRDVMPNKAKALRLYTGERPLFNKFNLEEQIESIYKRKVPLPSGGQIIIDGTEALTAIDVNSARATGKGDAEEAALRTNLEAAAEIARQLRLRDLGGLIVVDFIDMASPRNRRKVEQAMREALRADKARYDVTRISKLGLMELSRQRLRGEKLSVSYTACPMCEGFGLVKKMETAALAALRKLQTRVLRAGPGEVRLRVPPDVAAWLLNHKRGELYELERRHAVTISIVGDATLLRHQAEIETLPQPRVEEPLARVRPDRPQPPVPPDVTSLEAADLGAAAELPAGAAPEAEPEVTLARKRRRRRRKKKEAKAEAEAEATVPAPTAARPGEAALPLAAQASAADAAPGKKRRRRRRRKKKTAAAETPDALDAGQPVTPPAENLGAERGFSGWIAADPDSAESPAPQDRN